MSEKHINPEAVDTYLTKHFEDFKPRPGEDPIDFAQRITKNVMLEIIKLGFTASSERIRLDSWKELLQRGYPTPQILEINRKDKDFNTLPDSELVKLLQDQLGNLGLKIEPIKQIESNNKNNNNKNNDKNNRDKNNRDNEET
jgi:hypothetical protein